MFDLLKSFELGWVDGFHYDLAAEFQWMNGGIIITAKVNDKSDNFKYDFRYQYNISLIQWNRYTIPYHIRLMKTGDKPQLYSTYNRLNREE